jgi:hypothetical protein
MDTHSWAPEAFWDAGRGEYGVIYSAVNDSGHNVIMINYTGDFVTAGDPQVFFDPGYDVIDGDLAVGVNGVNYLYFKKNSTLVGARSGSLDPGSFTEFSTAVSHNGTEAPTLVKSLASGSTWYLWGDTWSPNGVFYAWGTSALSAGAWTALDQKTYTQPLNSKHCGIQPITSTEYDNLVAKWGTPAWNRLKSYNDPARYVRHSNFVGRIDEYAFDPYTDGMWKLVPGLADSGGVSFQSVNYPTRYLRHYNYQLQLDVNDTGRQDWPTPPGHRSGRTTTRRATSATPTTCCGSTPSPRAQSRRTPPSTWATDTAAGPSCGDTPTTGPGTPEWPCAAGRD